MPFYLYPFPIYHMWSSLSYNDTTASQELSTIPLISSNQIFVATCWGIIQFQNLILSICFLGTLVTSTFLVWIPKIMRQGFERKQHIWEMQSISVGEWRSNTEKRKQPIICMLLSQLPWWDKCLILTGYGAKHTPLNYSIQGERKPGYLCPNS